MEQIPLLLIQTDTRLAICSRVKQTEVSNLVSRNVQREEYRRNFACTQYEIVIPWPII